MKKLLLLAFVALAVRADAYTITNFSAIADTNWSANVIPKLNANNGNYVAWLNSINATNAAILAMLNSGALGGTNGLPLAAGTNTAVRTVIGTNFVDIPPFTFQPFSTNTATWNTNTLTLTIP